MIYPEPLTWVAGTAELSETDTAHYLYDPNTSQPLQRQRTSSTDQVDRAIGAAWQAHSDGAWHGNELAARVEALYRFAKQLEPLAERVAQLDALNSGVPISVTRLFAGSMADTVRSAADLVLSLGDERLLPAGGRLVRLRKVPFGPTALILPWNAPSAMAVKKLAFALAAGATTVIKPSSASPWSAQLIVEAAHESGLPSGVVNLVLGDRVVGEQLVGDSRIRSVSMTGSTATGKAVAARAGATLTRLQLELGSNNPAIVRADADMDKTATSIASGAMKLSGQWCEAPRRVLVARTVLAPLVEALVESLRDLRVGSSLADDTDIGPVAFRARQAELHAQRDELVAAGARAIETTTIPDSGWYVSPTVLVADTLTLNSEMFGPMITVQPVDDDDHAVRLANSGQFGLAGYVYSENLGEAYSLGARLIAGEVKVNGSSVLDLAAGSAQSFFADSGIGGHGDTDVLEFFRGTQVLGVDEPGLPI